MKLGNTLLVAAVLSANVSALELNPGESIYALKSTEAGMRGAIVASNNFYYANDHRLVGVDVFSHVKHLEYYSNGQYIQDLKVSGFASTNFVIPISEPNTAEVCFDEPIPTNAKIIDQGLAIGDYTLEEIRIPSYRNDRICTHVNFLGGLAEFMIILE